MKKTIMPPPVPVFPAKSGIKLDDLQRLVGNMNKEKGFDFNFGDIPGKLALVHSEVSEALEEYRDSTGWQQLATTRLIASDGKPEGFMTELADVVIRCMHLAEKLGCSLGEAVEQKILYNATRPPKHGRAQSI